MKFTRNKDMTWFQIPDCQDSCEASSWPKVIVVMASHTASIVSLLKFSSLPILKYCFNIVNIIIVYHNCIQTWQAILPASSHFWNFHHYQFWNIALILWISLLYIIIVFKHGKPYCQHRLTSEMIIFINSETLL